MAKTKSRYAEELEKRGFFKISDMTVSGKEKAKHSPSFTQFELYTFATDETGQSWGVEGSVDLSDLGFRRTP